VKYDYCTYPAFQEYENMSPKDKYSHLLERADDGTDGDTDATYADPTVPILTKSMWLNFDANSDIHPIKRSKTIHSIGIVGGVKFVSSGNHDYEGIFEGADHGIIRVSTGTLRPAEFPAEFGGPHFKMDPAVKFLRDGRRSANLLLGPRAYSGAPGHAFCGEDDFKEAQWSNHLVAAVDSLPSVAIGSKFLQVSSCGTMLGLSDAASKADGVDGKFPFEVIFKLAVRPQCTCDKYKECLAEWSETSVGTKLYDVEAIEAPDKDPKKIGEIILTSKMTRSKWGDEQLFFQHQHMEEDFELQQQWHSDLNLTEACGLESASRFKPKKNDGCVGPGVKPLCEFSDVGKMLGSDVLGSDIDACQ